MRAEQGGRSLAAAAAAGRFSVWVLGEALEKN